MSRHRINLFLIFLITLSFYGYFIRPSDWNIASRLGLVKAIVEEKRLVIDSYHEGDLYTGDKAFVNGHYYSDKAIGASLLGALVYLPIYEMIRQPLPTDLFIMLTTVLAISIPCALLAPLFYSIALRIVKEKWIALSVALTISLATPIFPYAGAFYGHSLAAALAFSIFFLWMEVNQFDSPLTPVRLILSGFLIGFMVLTEYPTLIIAIILFGYIMYVIRSKKISWDWKTIVFFLVGSVIPLMIFIFYNWICFGSPLAIGYASENLQEFKAVQGEGLMGIGWPNPETLIYMTIHPMQGIFILSPVLALAIGGFIMMLRERKLRAELVVVTSTILIYFLVISGYKTWWGGDAFTVRHLIPIFPFFGILMIFLPRKYSPLFIGLGLVSFSQMMIASSTSYRYFDVFVTTTLRHGLVFSWKTSLLFREMLPKLLHNRLTFSWGQYLFGLESWYFNFAIPIIAAIVLLIVFYFVNRKEDTLIQSASSQTVKSSKAK